MNILFISNLLSYGGASKLIFDLLPRMRDCGHSCELLILSDENPKYIEELEQRGIIVSVVPKDIKGHLTKIKYIKGYIEQGNFNIIHANLFPTIYYCSIIKRMMGKKCPPLIMTEHSTDNKRRHRFYLRPLEKRIYKNFDHIISISDKTQEKLCKWLETDESCRYSVVENGIDVDAFKNAKPIDKNELCHNYAEGDVLILTVGSFTPQKNHKKLLEALSFLPLNYKLILCGEGPLEKEIKDRVDELRLKNRVVFLGFRKDVARIMHTADVLVVPSIWEGFGLVVAEGMACGIPIVASDVSGLSDVIADAGVKFDPINAESLIRAIKQVEETRYDCIQTGFKRVNKYDIKDTTKKYLDVYAELASTYK